jgi:SWIM zinc finger
MKLTKMWLITNATDTSYSRGRGYESSVRKLKKEGDTYTAKVDGSETYKVEIVESPNGIEADCSCPYDYEGICKHIVAVGLNILSGNFTEVKTTETTLPPPAVVATPKPVIDATFYQKEFLKARKNKQEDFIRQLFTQDADIRRRFLSYINPPAPPLSISTDITELSNEIAARLADIDIEDYLDEDNDYHNNRYDDYDDEEQYDTDGLEKEVKRLLEPYGKKVMSTLNKGQIMDSIRILLAIYEAAFLVEEPEIGDYTDFTYAYEIDSYFQQITSDWISKIGEKAVKKSDFEVALTLILDRWQQFKRFQGKDDSAPYEQLNEDLFYFIVQKAEAENSFLDFMTENKLHTAAHYELTKKLCTALNKGDFLLDRLAEFGLNSPEIAKELMSEYIKRDNRHRFVAVAQQAYEKFRWQLHEFIADKILPTDNLGFFKKIVSEVASSQQRLDLYHRWREQVTPMEGEAYIDGQKVSNQHFYIKILADAKRFSDVLIFAEQNVEKLNSDIFTIAARLVLNVYPNEIFPLYCERVILYMGKGAASSRSQYQSAVAILKPVKEIKGKEQEIKAFAAELRKMYNRLPAFLDELKKGGF